MFSNSKNTAKNTLNTSSRIVQETKIKGDITTQTDFRLDGELIGNFTSKGKLVIGENATLIGDVVCKNLDIEGVYQGKADVQELLFVRSKAKIKGEFVVGKLLVEAGAEFTANCQMRSTIKNININGQKKSEGKVG